MTAEKADGSRILCTCHYPTAVISPSAEIGNGTFVMARAVANTNTVIEHGVLINSGAVVDHDSYVACGAHVG